MSLAGTEQHVYHDHDGDLVDMENEVPGDVRAMPGDAMNHGFRCPRCGIRVVLETRLTPGERDDQKPAHGARPNDPSVA